MIGLDTLILPIFLSAVFVFIMSSIIHMALPWHKSDYSKLPDEDRALGALRQLNIPPGEYMAPRPSSMADMKSPEYIEKRKQGPVLMMTVMPSGMTGMGKNLLGWFVFCVVVTVFSAYIAGRALPAAAESRQIFRFVGAPAFMGYSLALWPMSIWFRRSVLTSTKATVDGLIYAIITAATFCWLWPH